MKKIKKETQWEKGYDAGYKASVRENDRAVRIGNAILQVLYDVFELKKEDY